MNNSHHRLGTKRLRIWVQGLGVSMVSIGLMSACSVGPNFVRPAPPKVKQYTSTETPDVLSAGKDEPTQQITVGKRIQTKWWTLYHSPRLDKLLQEALKNSPDLMSAKATLAQVQETLFQTEGAYYPQLDMNASAQRQSTSAARIGTNVYTNLYSVGANVSFAPDVFGATGRRVEQASALVDNQRYQLAAAYLSLTGNVVIQVIDIASNRQQIQSVQDIIKDDEHNLHLVQLKYQAGKAARSDVLAAESQLANDLAQLPPLKQQLSVSQHALAVLVGKFPGLWELPKFNLSDFELPSELPLTIPSQLVRQRPDILAAEAQLHAGSAAIGIAASQFYPNLQLTGAIGNEALATSSLFNSANGFWSLVASLSAPIFHGGELEAQKRAATYAFEASAAKYRQTVLSAFGQVADILRALKHDAELVQAEKTAADTSLASLKLQRLSYTAGKADLLQLLDAERASQQARLGYVRALAQRYQDTAKLFTAMGGGWQNAKTLNPASEADVGKKS